MTKVSTSKQLKIMRSGGINIIGNIIGGNSGSGSGGEVPTLPDYTENLYDEWSANRNVRIVDAVTDTMRWYGRINNTSTGVNGSPPIPANGIMPFGGSHGISIALASNPSIVGAATFFFLIQKSALRGDANPLFDTNNAPSPRCVLYIERSSSVTRLAIHYNGVYYDADVDFPYGEDYSVVGFRLDGSNSLASIWLNGLKVSDDFAITGGGLDISSGTAWMWRGVLNSRFFLGNAKKARIYTEALSDANMAIVSTPGNAFATPILDTSDCRVVCPAGQSNNGPSTSDNFRINYDANLQTGLTDVELFNYIASEFIFIPVADTVDSFLPVGSFPIRCGPFLKVARDLKTKFPNDTIRIIEFYEDATSLAVGWFPDPPGTNYQNWIDRVLIGIRTLIIEQRNIVSLDVLWNQWESDGDIEARALAYEENLTNLAADMRTRIQDILVAAGITLNVRFIVVGASNRSSQIYWETVQNAQLAFVALDSTNNKFINTNDEIIFPFVDGLIHFSVVGLTNIGSNDYGAVQFIN